MRLPLAAKKRVHERRRDRRHAGFAHAAHVRTASRALDDGLPDAHFPSADRAISKRYSVSVGLSLRGVDVVQRLGDVGHQVLDIFKPDGQTEQIVADAWRLRSSAE